MNTPSSVLWRTRLQTALILASALIAAAFMPILTLLVSVAFAIRGITRDHPWRWPAVAALALVMLLVSPFSPFSLLKPEITFVPVEY
jgi:hypothetical protein